MIQDCRLCKLGNNSFIWSVAVFSLAFVYLVWRVPTASFLLTSNDEGYQLALGMEIAQGRFPGFAATGNVAGEMLMSALGYAAAITIAANIVRSSAGRIIAVLTTLGMLLWFPRFYKWYYSFFPLAGLMFSTIYFRSLIDGRRGTVLLITWAQLAGLAVLLRYDLGLESVVFGGIAILVAGKAMGVAGRRTKIDVGLFVVTTMNVRTYCSLATSDQSSLPMLDAAPDLTRAKVWHSEFNLEFCPCS